MTIYELYLTAISSLIIIWTLLYCLYLPLLRHTTIGSKGRDFILTKLFGSRSEHAWKYFFLSVVWLLVVCMMYKDFILSLLNNIIGVTNG